MDGFYLVDSHCEEARTSSCEGGGAIKNADPPGSLDRLIPKGEVENGSGHDARLGNPEEETNGEEVRRTLTCRHAHDNAAEERHDDGQVGFGADLLDDHIRRDEEEDDREVCYSNRLLDY